MKKNIKSLIGVLLCLVMLFSLVSVTAFAVDPSFEVLNDCSGVLSGVAAGNWYAVQKTDGTYVIEWTQIPADFTGTSIAIPADKLSGDMHVMFNPVRDNNDNLKYYYLKKNPVPTPEQYELKSGIDNVAGTITAKVSNLEYFDGNGWSPLHVGVPATPPMAKFLVRTAGAVGVVPAGEEITMPSDAVELEISTVNTYPLWVAGTPVTSLNLTGEGWRYYPQSNTLELTGTITLNTLGEIHPDRCAAIYYNDTTNPTDSLNIAVSSDSTVTCAVPGQDEAYGIYAVNGVNFVSTTAHKLTVYSIAANNISTAVKCGELKVANTITLEAASGAAHTSTAIESGSITNNGTIRAASSEMTYNPYEPTTYSSSVAMKVDGSVILYNENSSIEASAGAAYSSVAINAAVIDITKGSITAQSLQASANAGLYTATGTAILANTLDMKGGTITAAAASGLQTSEGMRIDNASTMSNGTLTVSSGDARTSSIALNIAYEPLTASAGTINANSSGANGKGISGQLIVTGNATVTAQGGGSAFAAQPSINYALNEPQVLAGAAAPGEKKSAEQIAVASTYTGNKYVNISTIIPVSTITLNKSTLTLKEGATETLIANLLPDNATDKTVTWSSSDNSIATVDSNTGLVTAVKKSVPCTITAKTANNKTATCTVTVIDGTHANQIILDKTNLTIEEGGTGEISFSVKPDDAVSKEVNIQAMDTTIVSLSNPSASSNKVTVTGLKPGTTKLLFKSTDTASTAGTVECSVTVTPKTYVTGIAITDATGAPLNSLTLTTKGAAKSVYAVVAPTSATNKDVEWTVTGDNTIVYLTDKTSTSCVVNAYGNGTAVLTATAKDGSHKYATLNITVKDTTSTYKFTYKENSGVWYYDYGTLATYTVKCDGPYSSFSGCLMDGYIVSPSYYYVTEGSTIVTFYPAYMQTLSHGRHTLTFVYNGTTTVSTYIWSRSLRDPPITGDSGTAGLIAAMSVSALAAASCTFFVRKKKEN